MLLMSSCGFTLRFTSGELDWPSIWADHAGHERTPSVSGH